MEGSPPPATRNAWAITGFAVPTGIALLLGLWVAIDSVTAPSGSGGYQGLFYIFAMVASVPIIGIWMLFGWLYARSLQQRADGKRFVIGATAGMGASILVLAATCFASYM